jgi:threonine/homoserine/homoserine lactone efflux protein
MWSTIIYIVLLILGIVGMAYYLYNGIRNKKLKEEGKEGKDNLWFMGVSIALMTVPIMHLTEKRLSPYINSEIALYFLQTLILIVLMLVISFIVKGIAKRDHISD